MVIKNIQPVIWFRYSHRKKLKSTLACKLKKIKTFCFYLLGIMNSRFIEVTYLIKVPDVKKSDKSTLMRNLNKNVLFMLGSFENVIRLNKKSTFFEKKIKEKLRILIFATCFTFAGCSDVHKEHAEAMNLSIAIIDFSALSDGVYKGYYYGGMYGWRENECEVNIINGYVDSLKLIWSAEDLPDKFFTALYGQVISEQSLQVDSISGSTLSSKAHLKSVESALLKAQR